MYGLKLEILVLRVRGRVRITFSFESTGTEPVRTRTPGYDTGPILLIRRFEACRLKNENLATKATRIKMTNNDRSESITTRFLFLKSRG